MGLPEKTERHQIVDSDMICSRTLDTSTSRTLPAYNELTLFVTGQSQMNCPMYTTEEYVRLSFVL